MEQHFKEVGGAPHHHPRHHVPLQLEEARPRRSLLSSQPDHHLLPGLNQVAHLGIPGNETTFQGLDSFLHGPTPC